MVCPIFGFLDGKWGGTTYMATLSAMLDPSSPVLVQPLTGLSLASRASSLLVIMFQSWNLRRHCLQPGVLDNVIGPGLFLLSIFSSLRMCIGEVLVQYLTQLCGIYINT
jgi:hypothetical protein